MICEDNQKGVRVMKMNGIIKRSIIILLSAAMLIAFMPMLTAESFAATKTVKVTNLVADATVSQSTIQTDLEKLGYHYVKLSWTGGSAATKYVIYSSTRSGSGYTKLATTKSTSQNLLLKKGVTYLKVRAYIKTTAQTLSTWVSINPGDINSTDITFTSKASSMTVGDKMTFKGKANGFVSSAVRWKSSNSKIATVSSSGSVTAVKSGTVNIIAIAHDGITKSTSLSVIDVYPKTVTISGASVRNMIYGSTLKLTATPSKAKYIGITWSSSKPSVAKVSSKGLVTALANGTTTITATAQGGAKDTVKVTVTPSVDNMVKWAMDIADDSSFGYSLNLKVTPGKADTFCPFCVVGASKDYCCATFVTAAINHGLYEGKNSVWASHCLTADTAGCTSLKKALAADDNFKYIGKEPAISTLEPGDILVDPNHHTEIFVKYSNGTGYDVGAHDDYDGVTGETGTKDNEIYYGSTTKYCYNNYTMYVYRYIGE